MSDADKKGLFESSPSTEELSISLTHDETLAIMGFLKFSDTAFAQLSKNVTEEGQDPNQSKSEYLRHSFLAEKLFKKIALQLSAHETKGQVMH